MRTYREHRPWLPSVPSATRLCTSVSTRPPASCRRAAPGDVPGSGCRARDARPGARLAMLPMRMRPEGGASQAGVATPGLARSGRLGRAGGGWGARPPREVEAWSTLRNVDASSFSRGAAWGGIGRGRTPGTRPASFLRTCLRRTLVPLAPTAHGTSGVAPSSDPSPHSDGLGWSELRRSGTAGSNLGSVGTQSKRGRSWPLPPACPSALPSLASCSQSFARVGVG